MGRKKRNKRSVTGQRQGTDLVFLAGLPRNTLAWLLDVLRKDTSKKHLSFDGSPSTKDDQQDLYGLTTLKNILDQIGSKINRNAASSLPTPRRIMILYVPAGGTELLIENFGISCYLEPLGSLATDSNLANPITWRHEKADSLSQVTEAIQRATIATDELKREITDKGRSALALPPQNFYFPDRESPIYETYLAIAGREEQYHNLTKSLKTVTVDRDKLAAKSLRSTRNNNRVFIDSRNRIFPAVIDHAPNRSLGSSDEDNTGVFEQLKKSEVINLLHQRYRFGVVARDGNLHYDVQYENPRQLQREPMYCAKAGSILVTGSHANVGINDVIWAPDGDITHKIPIERN